MDNLNCIIDICNEMLQASSDQTDQAKTLNDLRNMLAYQYNDTKCLQDLNNSIKLLYKVFRIDSEQ